MEKNRKIKVLSIIALLIAVVGLSIAFAAMNKTLTINGTANIDTIAWDVHFENLTSSIEGEGKIKTPPTLQENGTYIGDFEVSLSKPGDSVLFAVDIVNGGNIDAKFIDIKVNGISALDVPEEQMKQIVESVLVEADWDGDGITTNEEKNKCFEYIFFDMSIPYEEPIIKAGESNSTFTFAPYFSSEATELPKGKVTLSINLQLIYEQA